MKKKPYPLAKVYTLLEPGPVLLITTAHKGKFNLMTQSWHTMMEFEPPLLGCVISARNHTYAALKASRECVVNIPTAELLEQVVAAGNNSGRQVDKFSLTRLTPVPASLVQAPLIAECYASLECRVADTRLANSYNFFILEILKAWVDTSLKNPLTLHHRGKGLFMLAGDTVKSASRMK